MKIKGIYFLYRLVQVFGFPVLLLYFLVRALRNGAYWGSIPQRLGFLPRSFRQTGPGAIWLHAVSVGEVLACVELLRKVRTEFPKTAVFVSTSTLAGRATAEQKLGGMCSGIFYAPVDYVFAVRRVLRALRPSVMVIAETEIWPNLIREAKRTGAGVTIVNGRISDRAFPQYMRFHSFFKAVLPLLDSVLAQSDAMRERFVQLGAPQNRVRAAGNLKFDFEARPAPPDSPVISFIEQLQPARIWIAASTTAPASPGDVDEDDVAIGAFQELAGEQPGLMAILAPRKPERFEAAAKKLESAGVTFTRRSALPASSFGLPHVLLLDSIGELSGIFGRADVVFMGGTLTQRGGHNVLEPALFGKPVIAGPHMENFQAIADDLSGADALVRIGTAAELTGALRRLLGNDEEARSIGQRARVRAEAQRGAGGRAAAEIARLQSSGIPVYRPAMPWYAPAWLLSRLWKWGAQRSLARRSARARDLGRPVISVGNLTMGGTGKTPCVLRIAELLKRRGRSPAILTRGYGRSSTSGQLVLPPGASISPALSGDEPQIFIRSGVAPVGIGGDRFKAGTLLLRDFQVDTFLLDDGFQHAQLARDVDVVLVDAMEPFGRGGVFPLGRLREPVPGIGRADIVIITRSTFSDLEHAIVHEVRRWNRKAPVFRAGVEARAWVEYKTGREFALSMPPFERAGAFCGLGNPKAFRHTLRNLGVEPLDWVEFEDHHRYRPSELTRIAHQASSLGAAALVTTEKDAINLCEGCVELTAPLDIFWLKIGMSIEREDEFVQAILSLIE